MREIAVSACLLGELCRYDGKTKINDRIFEAFKGWKIIPFCPEAPLFGTPRERISVVHVRDENRIFTDETHRDVTDLLIKQTEDFIASHKTFDTIVLKSKSPSCGLKSTPIFNEKREIIAFGDGLSAAMFKKNYPNIEIVDENGF